MPPDAAHLVAAGLGAADTADPAGFARNVPSFYADPAAWLVATAAERALDSCAVAVRDDPDRIGVVAVSPGCSAATLAVIARSTARGAVSPLRFAGASPGVLAGLTCIRRGLRGPSLTVTMPAAGGIPVAAVVAAGWLRAGQAEYVLVAAHTIDGDGHHARCAVLRRGTGGPAADLPGLLIPA